jgi:nucleotide-binding universal stress UspA family protein
MLALSTFRQSPPAVELAVERAREPGQLVVVYVVDVNLARYFMGTDVGFYPDLMNKTEQELLADHRAAAEKHVAIIGRRAKARGVDTRTRVVVGRFARECLRVVRVENPAVVVTTRSDRPAWVRRFFGSPVDQLIKGAGCPVLEA